MTDIDKLVQLYLDNRHEYECFLDGVRSYFLHDPELNKSPFPIVHSLKYRLKDPEHLKDKLQRKLENGEDINENNLFQKNNRLCWH